MNYKVAIRNNATGEVRLVEGYGDWNAVAEYDWTDGNNGCDCNLAGNFHADNEEFVEVCGESAYRILYAELANGERIMLDAKEPPPTD